MRETTATIIIAILGSGVLAALIALVPVYWPRHAVYEWEPVPITDCGELDRASTFNSSDPQDQQCSKKSKGTIAVCWNGDQYRNDANPQK